MQKSSGRGDASDSTIGRPGAESCAHADCACARDPDLGPYCGAYCANAGRDEPEGACACEHEACIEGKRVRPSGREPATGVGPDPAS